MTLSVVISVIGKLCKIGVQDAHRGAQKQRVAYALIFLMRFHKEVDRQGVLLVGFWPQDKKINSAVYCGAPKKLRRAIQNKRLGMLSATVLLLRYNARPHSAAQTQDLITTWNKWTTHVQS